MMIVIVFHLVEWTRETRGSGPLMVVAVIATVVAFGYLKTLLDERRRDRLVCPHGMPGGQTRGLCAECQVARAVAERAAERAREETLRRHQFEAAARSLKAEECQRLRGAVLAGPVDLLALSPQQFENAIAELYRKRGFVVEQTQFSNDRGRDAVAMKAGKRYAIECKRYGKEKKIGRRDLQIFFASMREVRASGGIFVTTSSFASTAAEYANANSIELVDGPRLKALMLETYGATEAERLSVRVLCHVCGTTAEAPLMVTASATYCVNGHRVANDLTMADVLDASGTPNNRCRLCGGPMRIKRGRRGRFLGCIKYPHCRGTRPAPRGRTR